jgi:16S rRNA (guanine1207-N2)-methyltransferase
MGTGLGEGQGSMEPGIIVPVSRLSPTQSRTSGRPGPKYGRFEFTIADRALQFRTQPGVFSSDGPDEGSLLLVDAVLPVVRPHMVVVDLGTGVGLIGLSLAVLLTRGEMWMVDSDIRAARLAEENAQLNGVANTQVVLGDVTLDLPSSLRCDLVVSNPPTHSGKEVLGRFVDESYAVLRPGGRMYVVVNRLLSIRAMMSDRFGDVEQVARRKGFVVFAAQKQRRKRE